MLEQINPFYLNAFVLMLTLILSALYLMVNLKKEKTNGPSRKASFHRRKTWFFGFSIFLLAGIFITKQYFTSIVLVCWYLYIEYSYRRDLENSVVNLENLNLEMTKQKEILEEQLKEKNKNK